MSALSPRMIFQFDWDSNGAERTDRREGTVGPRVLIGALSSQAQESSPSAGPSTFFSANIVSTSKIKVASSTGSDVRSSSR